MKATIEIPDELYRRVEAKSALERRAVREVSVELYQRYVEQDEEPEPATHEARAAPDLPGQAIPSWFEVLGKTARGVKRHDMDAIRESIARGVARDRDL